MHKIHKLGQENMASDVTKEEVLLKLRECFWILYHFVAFLERDNATVHLYS